MSPEFEEETFQVDLEGLQVSRGNLYPQNEHDIYIYICLSKPALQTGMEDIPFCNDG